MIVTRVPFSVFEEILSRCDRPETPSSIHTEYRYEGVLDPDRMRRALAAAVAIHPMLRARQVTPRVGLRAPRWEIGDTDLAPVVRAVDCADDAEMGRLRDAFYSDIVSIERAPAARLLIVHRPGGDSLLVNVNHTIADGLGTLRFVQSLARAYTGRPDPVHGDDPIAARALKIKFGRERSPHTRKAGRAQNPRAVPTFIARDGGSDTPGYGILTVTLPAEQQRRLNAKRFGPSATVNDLLVAALHQTIAGWNETHGERAGVIVVLMPVNFRPLDWYGEVVGNLTLGGRIMTTPDERATPGALMTAVLNRTEWLKSGGGGLPLLFRLPTVLYGMLPLLFGALSRFAGDLRLSSVLTYYARMDGHLPDFGPEAGAPLEAWGSPPVILPTAIGIGAGILKGRLLLTLRYCRSVLDAAAAQRFADMLTANLLQLGAPDHAGRAIA